MGLPRSRRASTTITRAALACHLTGSTIPSSCYKIHVGRYERVAESDNLRDWMLEVGTSASVKPAAIGQLTTMGIGAGIFLIALGAILTFALDWTVAGLDMDIVGWILMAAGVLGLILFFVFWNRRRAPATAGQEPQLREPL